MMNILLCLLMPAGNDRIQMRYNTDDENFRNRWHHKISISLRAITYLSETNVFLVKKDLVSRFRVTPCPTKKSPVAIPLKIPLKKKPYTFSDLTAIPETFERRKNTLDHTSETRGKEILFFIFPSPHRRL